MIIQKRVNLLFSVGFDEGEDDADDDDDDW
jgi:hypothetical protein